MGLQLLIKQLTRSEWQPVVDEVPNFLSGWRKGLVARFGRLIMVNNVIRATQFKDDLSMMVHRIKDSLRPLLRIL